MVHQTIDEKLVVVMGRSFHSLEKALFKHVRSMGLTPTQFIVLEMLYHKGPLTVNEIIETSFSSSGNIGFVVKNLLKAGLVDKQIDTQDRRVRKIRLTETGRARIKDYYPEHLKEIEQCFRGVTTEEKKVLILLLSKLKKSFVAK
ncbi:MarR family winged helix-turn-helix transcriptional regulator [Candidatus Moduliflexota bacterium]